MSMFSCKGCVPPKRYPGCHGHCPEYLADKARYDALKAEEYKRQDLAGALCGRQSERIYKAMKRRNDVRFISRRG